MLKEYLESDLEDIHYTLRVTTDVINLLRAVENISVERQTMPRERERCLNIG